VFLAIKGLQVLINRFLQECFQLLKRLAVLMSQEITQALIITITLQPLFLLPPLIKSVSTLIQPFS